MAKRRRLKSMEDARRFIASVIQGLENDEIDTRKAGRLGYLAGILITAIRDSTLEERIAKLEEQLGGDPK